MIRPSALQIAEKCGLAPALAIQYPEASPAADRGSEIHRQIADRKPEAPEAHAALKWLEGRPVMGLERRASLVDPETGAVITEGTIDAVLDEGGRLHVVDWKTGRMENVEVPDENLQLHAYALAVALELGRDRYIVSLAFLDGDRVHVATSREYGPDDQWAILARVRAAASRPPVATPGPHCGGCWQRAVCPSYRARAELALTLLPNNATDLTLTDERAAELVIRIKAIREACDLAEEMARAHVTNGGRIEAGGKVYAQVTVAGRRSGPSVKDLEAQGLGHLVKPGSPSVRWEWRKAG